MVEVTAREMLCFDIGMFVHLVLTVVPGIDDENIKEMFNKSVDEKVIDLRGLSKEESLELFVKIKEEADRVLLEKNRGFHGTNTF